jgi:hypothetical protein
LIINKYTQDTYSRRYLSGIKMGHKKNALTVLSYLFVFAIGVAALVVGSIALHNTQTDDLRNQDEQTLTGHWDSTLNETLTVKFWVEDDIVGFEMKEWNGTLITGGGAYLTSSFVIPDKYLPKNYNETTAQAYIVPLFNTYTTAGTILKQGWVSINPSGKLMAFRDGLNSTSTWSFADRGQMTPVSGQFSRDFLVNYR